jgi:hypothetical protein
MLRGSSASLDVMASTEISARPGKQTPVEETAVTLLIEMPCFILYMLATLLGVTAALIAYNHVSCCTLAAITLNEPVGTYGSEPRLHQNANIATLVNK